MHRTAVRAASIRRRRPAGQPRRRPAPTHAALPSADHALPPTRPPVAASQPHPRRGATSRTARHLQLAAPAVGCKRRSSRLAGLPADLGCGPRAPCLKKRRVVTRHGRCPLAGTSRASLSLSVAGPQPRAAAALCRATPAALLAADMQRSAAARDLVVALLQAPCTLLRCAMAAACQPARAQCLLQLLRLTAGRHTPTLQAAAAAAGAPPTVPGAPAGPAPLA